MSFTRSWMIEVALVVEVAGVAGEEPVALDARRAVASGQVPVAPMTGSQRTTISPTVPGAQSSPLAVDDADRRSRRPAGRTSAAARRRRRWSSAESRHDGARRLGEAVRLTATSQKDVQPVSAWAGLARQPMWTRHAHG